MRAAFLLLLLAGCGSGGDEPVQAQAPQGNNHGYGFQYDVQGAYGLRLRGAADLSQLEKFYAETETCTGLTAPAPFVIIVPPRSLSKEVPGGTVRFSGEYFPQPSLILLDPSLGNAMKHESIHYLQDVVQGVQDPNHQSPLFAACS